MSLITPRIPPGTMELQPSDQLVFQQMFDHVRYCFESYGFSAIETPFMELVDVLLSKSGGETEKQVYFLQSTGAVEQGKKADMALHYDLTVPLARYVAQYERQLPFPFKRYQMQKVFRGERAQKGRFREFYQFDIDIVGRDNLSLNYDSEIIRVICDVFSGLNIGRYSVYLNNRKVLMGFLEGLGLSNHEQRVLALREIDKMDKIGFDAVMENLCQSELISQENQKELLTKFLNFEGSNYEIVQFLKTLSIQNEEYTQGIKEVELILSALNSLEKRKEDNIYPVQLNLKIARGLDYYTGSVFETFLDDHKTIGSICSGGRYENLVSRFSKGKFPGVGISIGATRLFDQLMQAGLHQNLVKNAKHQAVSDICVMTMEQEYLPFSYEVSKILRQKGYKVDQMIEADKLAKQLKYADKLQIPYAAIIGETEFAQKSICLKNLKTGTQTIVSINQLGQKDLDL